MLDKVFIDTNIFIYAFLNNSENSENHYYILYSEDMQHKQTIDNKIKIVNPFIQ